MKIHHFIILIASLLIAKGVFAQDTTAAKTIDSAAAKTLDAPAAQVVEPAETHAVFHFTASPSIGFTFQGISKDGEESEDLQWLSSLQAKLGYEGNPFQLNMSMFLQFGQQVSHESAPKKIQDDLQASVVPSLTLSQKYGLRLFLEVTGETEMAEGIVDGVESKFLDPLFLYQTLFFGHKTHKTWNDGNTDLEFVLGVGYAYQQTLANKFILEQNRQFVVNEGNPLQNIQDQFTVEKGYSAILQFNFATNIGDNFTFKESFKTVLLTKDGFTRDIQNSRVASLLLTSVQYKFISVDYTLHIIYDRNVSRRRQLDQTMVFGLKFNI
ncbi:MAG: hypothetical protein ACHQM6_00510 [Candidatus Kapaibacterium sp.]